MAGLKPDDVDAICSAAGGIEAIDAAEREGLARVFAPSVPRAALKRLHGETFGAAGAFGMAAALAWLNGVPVAPTDDAPKNVETVVVSTLGFYGNASAVVLRRP